MKSCYSCNSKPVKNGIYKSHLEKFIFEQLPKDNTHFHKKDTTSKIITNLKPNTCIFYFGSTKRNFTLPIKKFEEAYGKLSNSGVTRTDSKGNVKFYLDCPQVYISLDGNIYERHIHYLYWNEKSKCWNKNLYTQKITCDVDTKFVTQHINKSLLLDALPKKMYDKKHIKGAYNLPYNKVINENELKKIIKERFNKFSKNIPIISYCYNSNCNAAEKLIKKLNKLGYNNIVHYKEGIQSWKGSVEEL